jgi:hypothetical protein
MSPIFTRYFMYLKVSFSATFEHICHSGKEWHNRLIIFCLIISVYMSCVCISANADCQTSAITPVTVTDETSSIPNSSQLVNGTGTVVNTSTPSSSSKELTTFRLQLAKEFS